MAEETTTDAADPAGRERSIAAELKSVADHFMQSREYGLRVDHLHALTSDKSLMRILFEVEVDDWRRIAEADPDDLAARLPDWREQGRELLRRDRALATDFVAALDGDEAALDRLRRSEAEGGYGTAWLADRVPDQRELVDEWREMLADPDLGQLGGAMSALEADEWDRKNRSGTDLVAALVADYAAAQAGDGAARDRLRAPIAEGGHGEPVMAWLSARDLRLHHDLASIEREVAVAVDRKRALEYELGGYYDGPPWAERRDDDDLHYDGPTYG